MKKAKTRRYELIVTRHPNGALEADYAEVEQKVIAAYLREGIKVGSPNGRTSEHGFFTTLGLAIGDQFKKA